MPHLDGHPLPTLSTVPTLPTLTTPNKPEVHSQRLPSLHRSTSINNMHNLIAVKSVVIYGLNAVYVQKLVLLLYAHTAVD